jgi:energy-coupling factor transporter ATP-binding protein EcfA2
MSNLIEQLHINGYRGLSDLNVDGFGRVNLITGQNNSGKSTILECIRLLVTGGSVQTFKEILDYREETASLGDSERFSGPFALSPLSKVIPNLSGPKLGAVPESKFASIA